MESILELIMNNIFIIALLIGGLLSALNRNKNQDRADDKREKRREIDWETIFKQEEKEEKTNPSRPTKPVPPAEAEIVLPDEAQQREKEESYNERIKELKRKKEEAENKVPKIKEWTTFEEESYNQRSSRETLRSGFASISQKEAVNGVIWSEILGKPKSRRTPYYQSMRKHRVKS